MSLQRTVLVVDDEELLRSYLVYELGKMGLRAVEAGTLARKALAIDPNRAEAHVYLGNAEQEAGRIDEARAAYKKYLELAPNGPFARELRAILDNR